MNYRYIDTHAHVNINAFKEDWKEVIEGAREAGVAVCNVGTQKDTSARAVEIAEAFTDGVYAIVGLHPVHTSSSYHDKKELGENMKGFTSRGEEFDADFYRDLAKSKMVIAIGECGLDYYRLESDTKEIQQKVFIEQIKLANELNLPLMIHARDAQGNPESATSEVGVGLPAAASAQVGSVYDDVYEILKKHAKVKGNIHFYAGTLEQAKKFWEIGFSTSFTGVITFTHDYDEVIKNAPLDMLHAETDCPYVAPVPFRGKRCESHMVQEVYKKIALIRGEDEEKVRVQLIENAQKLYFSRESK
ncbi:TatD family hydrolase [Candidatus Pacebacteria bacterium]|nr:TatD family hydrolase [Candidatus Paceibacterota bacterium]